MTPAVTPNRGIQNIRKKYGKYQYQTPFFVSPPWPILINYRSENTRLGLKTPNLDSIPQTNLKSAPLGHGSTFLTSLQMRLCGKQTYVYVGNKYISISRSANSFSSDFANYSPQEFQDPRQQKRNALLYRHFVTK